MKTVCVLLVCFTSVCNVCVAADDGLPSDERSLKGLTGVWVVVEELGKDAAIAGVKQSTIATAVELRLRRNGIRVLNKAEIRKTVAHPFLYINVNVGGIRRGERVTGFVSYVDVELSQTVKTVHGHTIRATTWKRGRMFFNPDGAGIRQAIMRIVNENTDQFSNAFLKANSK